jgi:RNA polymerase sigma-70 factor, ECF subfamily
LRVAEQLDKAYELTLVLRSQLGDETAFAELLGKYSPRLRFFVAKMLHERSAQTDDVLQDVWLSVFRALPKLNDASAFHAWLFRIARDRVSREFRRMRHEFALDDELVNDVPAEEREEDADLDLVREHLTLLSPPHREALALRFIEDLSYEEIARVTGSSVGTVRSRIHYAKRALRRAFQENNYESK